jgi:hypothetical protein
MEDVSKMVNDQGKQLDVAENNINTANANIHVVEVEMKQVFIVIAFTIRLSLSIRATKKKFSLWLESVWLSLQLSSSQSL